MLVSNHGHLSARDRKQGGPDQALLVRYVDSTVDATPRVALRGFGTTPMPLPT